MRYLRHLLLAFVIVSCGGDQQVESPSTASIQISSLTRFVCSTNCLNVRDFGAFGDGRSHVLSQQDITQYGWNGKYQKGDEWDTVAISEAHEQAVAGMTVYVPTGTYLIWRKDFGASIKVNKGFDLKSGVALLGDRSVLIHPQAPSMLYLKYEYPRSYSNIIIEGFIFTHMGLDFDGSWHNMAVRNLTLKNCEFLNGLNPSAVTTSKMPHVAVAYANNFTIENCRFVRDSGYIGRGITIYKSHDVTIRGNSFDNSQNQGGFFVTAINVNGTRVRFQSGTQSTDPQLPILESSGKASILDDDWNKNIVIENNNLNRSSAGSFLQDQGIYTWGFDGLVIRNNVINGWGYFSGLGAIKVRDGQNALIES
ncbi:MAG: right-handed parallel beta-helix repeat-containing protein, partial [Deltaproteobacteria bacterium]|nr:right-handed parallel beta-helix repeat-containing protein [Deltaproteobacteria bacterium]